MDPDSCNSKMRRRCSLPRQCITNRLNVKKERLQARHTGISWVHASANSLSLLKQVGQYRPPSTFRNFNSAHSWLQRSHRVGATVTGVTDADIPVPMRASFRFSPMNGPKLSIDIYWPNRHEHTKSIFLTPSYVRGGFKQSKRHSSQTRSLGDWLVENISATPEHTVWSGADMHFTFLELVPSVEERREENG